MGPPDLWQSISDRLLPPQLVKPDFSLRNWSGRLSACKGYALYALYAPYALLGTFHDFHDFRASGVPERPPTAPTGSGMTLGVPLAPGNRFPIDCCRHSL